MRSSADLRKLLEDPRPEDALWWREVDVRYDELIRCCPEANETILKIMKEHPANYTHFWNVVEKIGRNKNLRREIIPWITRREPNIFTRHLLGKWWDDLSLGEKFVAVVKHGVIPQDSKEIEPWLHLIRDRRKLLRLGRVELIPLIWKKLSLGEKKHLLKRYPSLVYLLDQEEPCERLRILWYLAKRRREVLPLLMVELNRNTCNKEMEVIQRAVRRRYPRLLLRVKEVLEA